MTVRRRRVFGAVQLGVAALTLAAIVAALADVASRGSVNPFNFFGYFTVQSNVVLVIVWAGIGVLRIRGAALGAAMTLARAWVVVDMLVVGLVYVVLLLPLGAAGGVPLLWANAVMHAVGPLAVVVDWIAGDDRTRLRWSALPLLLVHPVLWTAVVLLRGATDGWVPYPFLDPHQGYGTVVVYVVIIALVFAAVAAAAIALSRRSSPARAAASRAS